MVEIVTFGEPVADIACFRTTLTKENSILVAQSNCNNTLTSLFVAIAIETGHDFFFNFILILRIYNTMRIAALEVDVDVLFALSDCNGVFPIDFFHAVAIFVTFQSHETELFHDTTVNAHIVAKFNHVMSRADKTVVR